MGSGGTEDGGDDPALLGGIGGHRRIGRLQQSASFGKSWCEGAQREQVIQALGGGRQGVAVFGDGWRGEPLNELERGEFERGREVGKGRMEQAKERVEARDIGGGHGDRGVDWDGTNGLHSGSVVAEYGFRQDKSGDNSFLDRIRMYFCSV